MLQGEVAAARGLQNRNVALQARVVELDAELRRILGLLNLRNGPAAQDLTNLRNAQGELDQLRQRLRDHLGNDGQDALQLQAIRQKTNQVIPKTYDQGFQK